MTTPKEALEAVLSFLDELAMNAAPGKRQALNPITIGGSAKLYAEGLRASLQGEDAVERVARNANRIWFDTEFIEDGKTIDLISIGMVRSDGATYYAETDQWIPGKAPQWVKDNVLVHLKGGDAVKPRDVIVREIVEFAGEKPEFWAYYADYDWVALCQLFGTMMQLPDGWPKFCRDIKQKCVDLGNPKLPEQTGVEHHALADALWNKQAWEFLTTGLAPDEAAQALTEAKAEIERLRAERDCYLDNWKEARAYLAIETSHAAQAESELSTLRARVREVVGPFARADAAIGSERGPFRFETGAGYRLIEREDLRAARQLNEDLK